MLSTMLADIDGIGEWGFSALVVADGHRILLDTGARSETVLNNARELKVDLTNVPDVVLTHNHGDHTGGLIALRQAVRAKNPAALAVTHAGEGIFLKRDGTRSGWEPMDRVRKMYEALGGKVIVHNSPVELYPGFGLQVGRAFTRRTVSDPMRSKCRTDRRSKIQFRRHVVGDRYGSRSVVVSGCGHAE